MYFMLSYFKIALNFFFIYKKTMFKFNFPEQSDDKNFASEDVQDDLEWLPTEHLPLDTYKDYVVNEDSLHTYKCDSIFVRYHDVSTILQSANICGNSITLAEQNQSDLIPSKYEGGLKIWECTYDLAEFLLKESSASSLSGYKVLDVGCGAGLLGILALKLGAFVTFQDYNKEVLETITIPNVLANLSPEERTKLISNHEHPDKKLCQFYSGDWASFVECCQVNSSESDSLFDYILTSETIYNSRNHQKLYSLFRRCLKRSGSVYLAAKTYYFGVGGGTRQFEEVVANHGEMTSNVCWKSEGGLQREILKIMFKD